MEAVVHRCANCAKDFEYEPDVVEELEFCSFHCSVTFVPPQSPEVNFAVEASVVPLFPVVAETAIAQKPEPEPEPPAPAAAAAAVAGAAIISPEQLAAILDADEPRSTIAPEAPICRYCTKAYDPAFVPEGFKSNPGFCSRECLSLDLKVGFVVADALKVVADNANVAAAVNELEQSWAKPQLLATTEALAQMDDESLVVFGGDVEATIAQIEQKYEAELAPHREERKAILAEIERRTLANQAEDQIRAQVGKSVFRLPVPGFQAGVEISREIAKFIDVLRGLKDLVTEEEFNAAIYQEKMPKPEDLPWTANMTKLKSLVNQYGEKSEVGKIIAKGTVYREKARKVFLRPVKQPEKNVTPVSERSEAA